ncbi:MAG: hypothetical protein Q4F72_07610 [Desulfovibrionaceae bacterium]|nr:hypothetical protein [Desulfovibrionaceae bacterium]
MSEKITNAAGPDAAVCEPACGRLESHIEKELERLRRHGDGSMEADLRTALLHGRQVCRLVRSLFDGLKALHGLDSHWRGMICLAAMLHDIGQIAGMKGHHKSSCRLIRGRAGGLVNMTSDVADSLAGLLECVPEEDRECVALLARYHRKVWPSTAQKGFCRLSLAERQGVAVGSSLLRVADGLDMSHESLVERLEAVPDEGNVLLILHAREGADRATLAADAMRGVRKGDLFTELFGRNLKWQQH